MGILIDILLGFGLVALWCAPFIWFEYTHEDKDK